MSSRAQIFFLEFFLAIAIFTLAILLFHKYDVLGIQVDEERYISLVADAQGISDALLGSGIPLPWNISTVQRIGLTNDDQRIDEAKLEVFNNISYTRQRFLLNTEHEFSFHFLTNNLSLISFFNTSTTEFGITGIDGSPLNNIEDLDRLITVERTVIVDNQPGLLRLYVWAT